MSRVQPQALKRELRRRVEFDKSLEENVKKFIRVLVQEAVNCEVYGHESVEKVPKKSNPMRQPSSRVNKGDRKGTSSDMQATGRKTLPICIWPKHKEQGVRHYLRDCKDCPKYEKDKLFDDLWKRKTGGIKRTSNKDSVEIDESTSTIFSATSAGSSEPPFAPTTVPTQISSTAARQRS